MAILVAQFNSRKLLSRFLLAGVLSFWPSIGNAATQVVIWGWSSGISSSVVLTNFDNVVEISSEGGFGESLGLKNNGSIIEDDYTFFMEVMTAFIFH